MAGGKETPRQKMIGMMYLVLTAMLALNVSSAILLKFQFIDASLKTVNDKTNSDNRGVLNGIRSKVEEGAKTSRDLQVVKDADAVRNKTTEVVTYIRDLRAALEKEAGGSDPETGGYKNPENNERVNMLMIGGPNKNGKAYELERKLNEYALFLKKYNPSSPDKLARSGKEDIRVQKNRSQRQKDFAELNFEETPIVAALATLSQMESEVLKYETDALSQLAQKVGADIIKFENIFAQASAESRTVAAGTKYRAEMFLAATSSAISPSMTVDGRPVKVQNGRGVIEFPATAGNYDAEGNAKKTWKGTIRFRQANGRDTTFTVNQEYVVAKPVMQIQSAAINSLYYNCANELNVQVPALGANYDPSFSANGATVVKGAQKGMVTIIPTGRQVKLNVSSGGNAIGSQEFTVKQVPLPKVVAYANGQPMNVTRGIPAPGPRTIEMRAIADESFASLLPKEARYRVTAYTVYLVRGARPVNTIKSTNPTVNISSLAAQARPGDRIAIQVDEVKRMNSRNQQESVPDNTQVSVTLN